MFGFVELEPDKLGYFWSNVNSDRVKLSGSHSEAHTKAAKDKRGCCYWTHGGRNYAELDYQANFPSNSIR